MQNILKKTLVLVANTTVNLCTAQLKDYDLAVIKHYPPVAKQLVNPQTFTYKSDSGVTLQYQLSEGDFYRTKVDSLAEIDRLDALDDLDAIETYTDGVMNAWVEGTFKVNNITYLLFGSYAGEGYLQGALYDKNKSLYGLLEWESDNNITVTLKTKASTFKYNLSNGKKYPEPRPTPKNDALAYVLEKEKDKDANTGGTGAGSGRVTPKVEKDILYLSDLVEIENLSDDEKIKQIKKWSWEARLITGKSKDDNYIFATKSEYGLRVAIRSKSLGGNTVGLYSFSNCSLGYVNQFVEKAKKEGYHLIEDKKAFLKLKSDDSVITINKSILEYNQQYFTIEVK